MLKIMKFSVGLQPPAQAFRVANMWGDITDAVIAGLSEKPIRDPLYFSEISSPAGGGVQLRGRDSGSNLLSIGSANIVFTQERYTSHVNLDRLFEEFAQLWKIIDGIVRFQQIRRIGMVAEHRISDVEDPSKFLVEKLTKYPVGDYLSKFSCVFERRSASQSGMRPNLANDGFLNVIHNIYDSELDVDVPSDHAINTNLDVQRYYDKPCTGKAVIEETRTLRREFESSWGEFKARLLQLGVTV